MPDSFLHHQAGLDSPAFEATSVTPSDSVDLGFTARGLYVGSGGDVAVIPKNGSTAVTLRNVQSGTVLPVSVKRVLATGTTATQIVALW
jgi:hypothetical protein